MRIFSTKTWEHIEALESSHLESPHLRVLQKELAEEITTRVHSGDEYKRAVKASQILFGKSTQEDLREIDEKLLLDVFEGVPQVSVPRAILDQNQNVTDFLSELTNGNIFKSKGEARRMISGGSVAINKTKILDANQSVDFELINGKYLLVQKGKKNYYLVKAE